MKKCNLPKLILFLIITITIISIFTSCTREIIEEKIIFPDSNDDRKINNTIVAYNIFNDNIYPGQIFPMPSNAPAYIKKEIWEKEQKAIEEHKKRFKLFTDIIPAEYRKEITRFTVFYPEEGSNVYATMGVRKENSLKEFSLGLAYDVDRGKKQIPSFSAPDYKINTLGYDIATYAMIHEFGHYVTKNKTQMYLGYIPESDNYVSDYKDSSFIKQIVKISWVNKVSIELLMARNPSKIFNSLPGEFVSAYACRSMDEDGAETFTHFVLLNDKPEDVDGKSKKILLFYKDPEMVKLRTEIRQNLQKVGITPSKPNA